ncbi:hypothetical protein L7F22_066911 [Adiantum nelumboides]|nr:hypothetical protein [Adiantum nelumboides]
MQSLEPHWECNDNLPDFEDEKVYLQPAFNTQPILVQSSLQELLEYWKISFASDSLHPGCSFKFKAIDLDAEGQQGLSSRRSKIKKDRTSSCLKELDVWLAEPQVAMDLFSLKIIFNDYAKDFFDKELSRYNLPNSEKIFVLTCSTLMYATSVNISKGVGKPPSTLGDDDMYDKEVDWGFDDLMFEVNKETQVTLEDRHRMETISIASDGTVEARQTYVVYECNVFNTKGTIGKLMMCMNAMCLNQEALLARTIAFGRQLGVENPYQELKQLLEGKPSSKKKGHAQHERSPSREREESESSDESMEDVAPRRRRAQRSPTPTKWKRSPHSPHHCESKREDKNFKKKKERKRSPSSPSSSPSSSSDEGSGYSSQERQRRGHQRSYAAWKRASKLKKFKEGGKNISFLTYYGTFGASDKVLAFIQQLDAVFGDEGFTESLKLRHVAMHFQKSARQWWVSLWANGEATKTWKASRASIMKTFLASDAKDKVLPKWRRPKLSPYESIHK